MRWVLTIGLPEQAHGHVEVGDPQEGAIVLNEIMDSVGHPLPTHIEDYVVEWHCSECGQWRLEPERKHA